MRSDDELRADLIERFDAIPSIGRSDIDVHVQDGMVTLTGQVETHQTRFQVERAARKVAGVRGLKVQIKSGEKIRGGR